MSARAALALCALALLAACQSTPPPPPPQGKPVAVGDWTVTTGGYVRAEAGIVR